MRVIVLGADGYLGWPTAMRLSAIGHEVLAVDNYLRRRLAREADMEPLTQTPNLHERANLWKAASGHDISVHIADISEWDSIAEVFSRFSPEAIIHYAEQPSAPYSMLSRRAAGLTLRNNLDATFNVIAAVQEFCPDAHIIKLGTMGEYGTPNIDIEEGWLDVHHNGRSERFLYPRQAGSLYHTTKIMDTDLLWFYVRVWNLRVTDLMQGPVYGIYTQENRELDALTPFFNYDEIFGTVVNRFVTQAVNGYPLTVYGEGGQTRGYLNILDTLQCVELALGHPADPGQMRIFNQFTETFTVSELAEKVLEAGRTIGIDVKIQNIENPRTEAENHYYNPKHTGLFELGLKPHLLTQETLCELMEYVTRHRDNIDANRIFRGVRWLQ